MNTTDCIKALEQRENQNEELSLKITVPSGTNFKMSGTVDELIWGLKAMSIPNGGYFSVN